MRIGLNATCFNDRPSGARQRFVGIYGSLIRRCPDIEFIIYEPSDCAVADWFVGAPNVRAIRTPLPSTGRIVRSLRGWAYWRRQLARDNLDLFESFHLPLVSAPCPTIVTINDARSAMAAVPFVERSISRHIHRRALRRAARVITVSEAMKRELLEIEPSAAITTVYNGINPAPFARPGVAAFAPTRERLGLPGDFILAVGHFEKRKNYARLVEALAILRETRPGLALVIVGNDGGELAATTRAVERRGLQDAVTLRTNVTDDNLIQYYRASRLVVFPSCYEGFGIPLLEAMAARRPLVLSDLAVFVELTEGQGSYFPASDSAAMGAMIATVLDSPDRQADLVAYGDRRVGAFGFDLLAAKLESIYRQLLHTDRAQSITRVSST